MTGTDLIRVFLPPRSRENIFILDLSFIEYIFGLEVILAERTCVL